MVILVKLKRIIIVNKNKGVYSWDRFIKKFEIKIALESTWSKNKIISSK